MVAKRSSLALALLLVLPSAGFALSLGDIRLLSSLNSPLDAEIDLADVTPEEHQTLKAQIAPRDVFARNGLDYPAFLANVQVRTVKKPDGREVVKLTSSDPITEPFVTVLVEVDYARGRFVREYTMLLDPPVYTPNQSVAGNAPVAAPTAGAGARGGDIARAPTPAAPPVKNTAAAAPSAAAPSPASSPPPPAATASGSSDSTHLVRRGENLSQIASAAAGSGSNSAQTRSWMLAIYEANPRAFDQNMNLLRSGAVLRMPDAASVAAVNSSEATAEIRKQYAAWRGTAAPAGAAGGSEPGHLKLVTPNESGSAAGPASAATGQVKALQGQVQDLEGQLSESKRLLELRNRELADLQAKLAAKQGSAPAPAAQPSAAAAPTPEAKTSPPVAQATPPAAEPTPAPPPAAAAEEPAAQAQPAPAPEAIPAPAAAAKKPVHLAPEAPAESGGILDVVMEYWWALAALVVVILGYFGFKAMRSRRQSEFDDSLGRLASAGAESVSTRGFATGETPPMRSAGVAAASEDAFLVEESGTHERPAFPGAAAPTASARHVSSDETISSDTAINLDQGDPLAEADFHMAYGLYDQAADLIRIAISREPERRDLKLKLLEVFFVWGNKDQFLQTARELASTREDAAPGEWEKIVIMGKQLAPEDPMFSAGGGISGATDGGVDLDLEGGQSRVDFDLLGESVPSEAGVDLDIGSALGDTNQQPLGTATDRNAAIDQSFSGSTATTRQMTQRIGRDDELLADFGSDPEAPTVEQPAISSADNPTIRQKVEIAMRQGAAEQTAELAIDDLGLDLGALDTIDQPGLGNSPDAPTLVAGLDDRSRRIMEEAQHHGGGDKQSSTGTWHMDEHELDAALAERGNGADNGHDPSATSRLAALSPRDVDYDLGEMNGSGGDDHDHDHTHAASGNGLDLDVGTATVPDTAFTSTQKLSSDDLALPDLEPVTMSEVGTKLDLARAYMDMGDPDGARNILEEVMHEGSNTQKQEAQRLMESLPG